MSASHGPGTTGAAPRSGGAAFPVRTIIGFCLYVGGYLALIGWFKAVDVYHAHFETTGVLIAAYNLLRVVFIFYLFWIVYGVGAFILRRVGRETWRSLDTGEQLALGFFTGAGLWHVALLGLGLLGLYTVPVAVVLTVPVVALTYPDLRQALHAVRATVAGANASLAWRAGLVILLGVTLLVVKGLYPGGGHDYFQHYFYFFQTVVDRGGIWPNEVWYHFYDTKGASLYFLAMLLTDPLAPQLVTACFMAVCALVVFLLCRGAAPGSDWPLVGVALFLASYIYTPVWGQFEKLHELNTCFLVAIVWMAGAALEHSAKRASVIWAIGALSAATAAIAVNPTTAIVLGAVFGLLGLWYLSQREWRRTLDSFGLAALAGVSLLGTLALNWAVAGIPSIQGIQHLWPFANIEKLHGLGYLPLAIIYDWADAARNAAALSARETVKLIKYAARFDLLFPLLLGGVLVAATAVQQRWRSGRWAAAPIGRHRAALLLTIVLVFLVIALTGGRAQPESFFRHASFMVPILIVASIGLWGFPTADMAGWMRRVLDDRRMPFVMLALTLATIIGAASERGRLFDSVLPRAWQFATGAVSIDTAYTLQQGWPNKPWGAIHPAARAARLLVGPRTPIWSMHATIYCMLPDCRVEESDSFAIGSGWDELMFGTPEQGRRALQAAGINYFLFSRDLEIHDYLPFSPLLAPDNIARYLGIRWTDGTTALLTWSGPDTVPLDPAWVEDYRRAVAQSGFMGSIPYAEMQPIYAKLKATPHPWRTIELPWRTRAP